MPPIGRRRLIGALLGAAVVLAGCGTGPAPTAPAAAPAPGFPVTITHAFGTTEITARPTRIVTVGYTDAEYPLAFDVQPVGWTSWFADRPSGVGPWADAKVTGTPPVKLPAAAMDFETIARLDPDLIVGFDNITAEQYSKLTAIAPTVAPKVAGQYGHDWRESVRTMGQILGEPERATSIIEGLDAKYDAVKKAHPEFAGRSAVYTYGGYQGGQAYYVFKPSDPRQQFLTGMGFVQPQRVADIAASGTPSISPENVGLLDADVLLLQTLSQAEHDTVYGQQLFRQLPVVEAKRVVELRAIPNIVDAISLSTPLSQPYVIDNLVTPLAESVAKLPD
ncbi:iron-siderophore ABC transporter substrate-binding protein [Pseudonocardia sp. TRM90224]|uniref:iron-siderophore ABC transporter substrate-binding protein n=1 Tax=Pseudonocardia sp. TRM90224 TaxID=2812678 RepID=UPI001E4683EB|nr:iron-siderophore ABC transporter substrate-binding protein [Pseudonocardia sp. TRM90224]